MKLVFCDIDGTLIGPNETLSNQMITTVQKLREMDVAFSLATGRTFEMARPFVDELMVSEPYVINNGATIMVGERCLFSDSFSANPLADVLEYANSLGVTITLTEKLWEMPFSLNEYVKTQQMKGRFLKMFDKTRIYHSDVLVNKIMFYDNKHEHKTEKIYERLQQYHDLFCLTYYPNQTIELAPRGCTKAKGIEKVAQILEIPMCDIMVCGDGINDIEMLQAAGVGVAVGNALDEVKQVANYVSSNVGVYGVLEAIETLIFRDFK